jgi:pimeloyl-ACP methyl ester carboxylesterase
MTDTLPCDHDHQDLCAGGTTVTPAEALRRSTREASRGIVNTGRYRMPYLVWGEGPPLVFVHGLGDTSRSFLMPMALLSSHFRCISYDLPTGRGDRARLHDYRHRDLVHDLFALLDQVQLKQSYLYGSSFGSTIALAAAHAQPQRVPRLLIQGGFAWRPLIRAELLVARLTCYVPGLMHRLPYRERILQRSHFEPFAKRPPEVWQTFLEWTGDIPIAATARQALVLHRLDLRRLLPQIRQPVLLVCGDRDPLIGAAQEDVLLQGLPNAARVVIPDCGHMASYTHPEALALITRDFLTPPPA